MPTTEKSAQLGGGGGTPTEKASHYRYLKEFRVEQCTRFPQHKCKNHRPFTCFNWHFPNQRRRKPLKGKDGIFNYSAEIYCPKYDETKGTCPAGDACNLLHRPAGDAERRYHLRYYKTSMCVHGTDSRGFCTENGANCSFAHGDADKRQPVVDSTEQLEIKALNPDAAHKLGKEHDPKWQISNYVMLNYKTEPCVKIPPRTCRQGYGCPQYHNLRDRRRAPNVHQYKSTPCPNVKNGDEWLDPSVCEEKDNCRYCHTRTEQQFHPRVYKSTKCNDMEIKKHCPRGQYCAFAHPSLEIGENRSKIQPTADTTKQSPVLQQDPTIPKSNTSCHPITKPYSAEFETLVGPTDTYKDVLLMGTNLMDNRKNEDEDASLIPVGEVEVELQDPAPTPTPTSTTSVPVIEDHDSRPESPPLDKDYLVGGVVTVSPDAQFFYNITTNGAESTSLESPVMTDNTPQSIDEPQTQFLVEPQDLTYCSLHLLNQCKEGLEMQLALITMAMSGHSRDSPHYSCLRCQKKDVYRSVIFVPCDHQVVCMPCALMITHCPMCHCRIRNVHHFGK